MNLRTEALALLLGLMLAIAIVGAPATLAQTLNVLHTFAGPDGSEPVAGLIMDRVGNLYGTTSIGGAGYGTVFKLSRVGASWVLHTLYTFQGGNDGATPQARVVFGPDGTLYGTATAGGSHGGGTVFNLRPPPGACLAAQCPWKETVLYSFMGGSDGASPQYGDLAFDAAGNIYGTTSYGGGGCSPYGGCGVVFKLSQTGGSWTENVLYAFSSSAQGYIPFSGIVLDGVGNLYGTTFQGGTHGLGTVYELTHLASGWTQTTLHSFGEGGESGGHPYAGLTMDQYGNLYGTTASLGSVYELQPSGGTWTYEVLQNVPPGPYDAPTIDASGNLYATASGDFSSFGNVFKLTPGTGGWTYTDLYDFFNNNNFEDGFFPLGAVVLDGHGNIYGTTFQGGDQKCGEGCGVVWEITP